MPKARRRDLLNKRLLGYVNWHRGRKLMHRRDVLDALTHDIKAQNPDQIAVTGDLVNIGLPEEFLLAAAWLRELGPPTRVTAIPGNHDAYVRLHPERGTGHWRDYMQANEAGAALFPTPATGYPFVRRFGDIALIGTSTAIPTAPLIAAGRLGHVQREALGQALERLGKHDLFRVVMIHHPPLPGQADWRRGLRDARKVTAIFERCGVELVLHGHNHEASVRMLETATGHAFVIGVPSASEAGEHDKPAAAYNEYGIARVDGGWHLDMLTRAPEETAGHIGQSHKRVLRAR